MRGLAEIHDARAIVNALGPFRLDAVLLLSDIDPNALRAAAAEYGATPIDAELDQTMPIADREAMAFLGGFVVAVVMFGMVELEL